MALVADLLPALQPSAFVAHHARRGDLPEMHYLRGEGSAWVAEVRTTYLPAAPGSHHRLESVDCVHPAQVPATVWCRERN